MNDRSEQAIPPEAPPKAPPKAPPDMARSDGPGRDGDGSLAGEAAGDQRVSVLIGDRLCTRCGFNLHGQLIVREWRYGMLIARCPECAEVAAVQEYPSLGKWANRWAALLAAVWMLILLAGGIGVGAGTFGFTMGATFAGSEGLTRAISDAYMNHLRDAGPVDAQTAQALQYGYYWQGIPAEWWAAQDAEGLLRSHGGLRGLVLPTSLMVWAPEMIVLFAMGCAGSVALLHMRRGRMALIGLAPFALTAALGGVFLTGALGGAAGPTAGADSLALRMVAPVLIPTGVVIGWASFTAGLMVGRPLARWAARAMLPPRQRHALGRLWIADGLESPRTSGGRAEKAG